jgi:CRP-like cAMP-binding protein
LERETDRNLRSGWLGQVPPPLADAILRAGSPRSFRDGEVIYGLGQDQSSLWGIASGLVRMWVTMNEQPPRFGHVAGPGFWFGETEFVTGRPGIIEMAVAGETTMLTVPRRAFGRVVAEHPGAWSAVALLAVLNQGLAIGAADDLMIRDARQRLCAVLLRLSSNRNAFQRTPPVAHVPATQAEIAEAANLSRSSTAALLAEMSGAGLIRTEYRRIDILDPDGLTRLLVG